MNYSQVFPVVKNASAAFASSSVSANEFETVYIEFRIIIIAVFGVKMTLCDPNYVKFTEFLSARLSVHPVCFRDYKCLCEQFSNILENSQGW